MSIHPVDTHLLCLVEHFENKITHKGTNLNTPLSEHSTALLAEVLLNWCHSDSLDIANTLNTTMRFMMHISSGRHNRGAWASLRYMVTMSPCSHSRGLST